MKRPGWPALSRRWRWWKRLKGRANGRIQGFLSPAQVDTCTEELLELSRQAAEDLDVPLTLHTSQAVFEFQEMVRRHGLTPIEWLESIGFLSKRVILGHVMFPAGHSWVNFAGDDLAILARHGVSVAHATWVFQPARPGIGIAAGLPGGWRQPLPGHRHLPPIDD